MVKRSISFSVRSETRKLSEVSPPLLKNLYVSVGNLTNDFHTGLEVPRFIHAFREVDGVENVGFVILKSFTVTLLSYEKE